MPVSVDIVLPCFNPNDKWHFELLKFNEKAKERYHLNYIVVNDGSTSGAVSSQIDFLQKHNIRLDFISYSANMGKGFALRRGVAVAQSEYIIYTDIDFPFNDESMFDLIDDLTHSACDVIAGFRNEIYYQNKMSWFRRTLSKSFRFFIGDVLKMPVTDTQCGLKGFNRKGREQFLKTTVNRYLFDFEFIYRSCHNKSLVIRTIPVNLKDNVVFSSMKMKILLQEAFNLIRVLIFRKN